MTDYFYTDASGNRRGPFNEEQIKQLAKYNHISLATLLETDDGSKMLVEEIVSDLNNPDTSQTSSATSPGLFDIGFTRFITNTWISIIWVLTIVLTFLGCVGAMVFGASNNAPELFIIAPIASLLSLLFMWMSFEVTIVLLRIETHLRTIREKYENK